MLRILLTSVILLYHFISPVKTNMMQCCDRSITMECIGESARRHYIEAISAIERTEQVMIFVTYFTSAIRKHSLLAYAINSQYTDLHDYYIVAATPELGYQFDTNDERWNKVKILEILMKRSQANHTFVWIDSDLIFNHLDFSFEELLQRYNTQDMIISREINPQNGIANTGLMVLRRNAWTLHFLDLWWNKYDRAGAMDQHVLDRLYHEIGMDHIALLPPNAINSIFPGLITYQNHEPVLHLAGESNFIRYEILKLAWENLCKNYSVPVRSLVSRQALQSIDYLHLHALEWQAIETKVTTLALHPQGLNRDAINSLRYQVREAQQSASKFVCTYNISAVNGTNCTNIKAQFVQPARRVLHFSFQCLYDRVREVLSNGTLIANEKLPQEALSLMQDTIEVALEYLLVADGDGRQLAVLTNLQSLIYDHLLPYLHPSALPGATYYAFKVEEFLGAFYWQSSRYSLARDSYRSAVEWFQILHLTYQYFGSGNQLLNRFEEGIKVGIRYINLVCVAVLDGDQSDGALIDRDEVLQKGLYLLSLMLVDDRDRPDWPRIISLDSMELAEMLRQVPKTTEEQFLQFGMPALALMRYLDRNSIGARALEDAIARSCVLFDDEGHNRCRSIPTICSAARFEALFPPPLSQAEVLPAITTARPAVVKRMRRKATPRQAEL